MALLETGRGTEAVGYYQRVLKSFPLEEEVKAFGTALYYTLGAPIEALGYWKELSPEIQEQYRQQSFLKDSLLWGPKACQGMQVCHQPLSLFFYQLQTSRDIHHTFLFPPLHLTRLPRTLNLLVSIS
jgi:hypothetical protein